MKTIYVCEKCNSHHDTWDDSYKCELSHASPQLLFGWDFDRDAPFPTEHYRPGEVAPTIVYMKVPVLDEDGNPVMDANGCPMYEVFPFKRMTHDNVCEAMEISMRQRWCADNLEQEDVTEG